MVLSALPSLPIYAEALHIAGSTEEALDTLNEALPMMKENGDRIWEANAHTLKGEMLLAQSDARQADAEACYIDAIDIARDQNAMMWELRASIRLAHLWHGQGKTNEARDLLAPVYSWFTEGFDTADLKDAKALLDELS